MTTRDGANALIVINFKTQLKLSRYYVVNGFETDSRGEGRGVVSFEMKIYILNLEIFAIIFETFKSFWTAVK